MSKDDRNDLEARLQAIAPAPRPAVKLAVMSAFRHRHAPAPIWSRGVPVYAVVALLAVAVGATLFAERTRPAHSLSAQPTAVADTALTWSFASRDVL